ncbi:MAG: PKD domain-containing protein [Flavobacteriia bacterium]|nr:PKD domain-containing protein [Flavobacteriia bacterium]
MQKIYSLFIFSLLANFIIAQGPTAQFTASPLSICEGESVIFTNTSTQGNSPITQYAWDFGDGNSANTQNSSHIYTTPGTYTIILVVTDQNNIADPEVKTNYITVNPKPNAIFTMQTNGCTLPVNVNFTNQSTTGTNIIYNWNFGNGNTSTLQNPTNISYSSANTYAVTLIVTNTQTGCSNTTTNNITISNFSTDFDLPDSICIGSSVNLTDLSTTGVNLWSWNNGNGQTSTNQNPTFIYNTAGTYTITLNSQNTIAGCTDSQTHQIVVIPLPVPSFSGTPLNGCAPLNVTFTNTSSSGSNFVWTFGDGTTYNGQTPPIHTYNSYGNFTVTLSSTGILGCQASNSITNYIITTPPIANFSSFPTNGCTPLTVNFINLSSSTDPITNWLWDFGDGTTYNGQTPPAHIFNTGVYDISLTITTQNGCTDTEIKNDYIQVGEIDLVNFSYLPAIQCAKSNVTFTDLSIINTPHLPSEVTYNWSFGDGGTSTVQNPTWSYPTDTGYFDVQLIVNFRGCKDTLLIDSAVFIKAPISLFSPAQTLYCNPSSFPVNVAVTDNAIIGKASDDVKMIWRWGDALNSNTILEDADLDPDDDGSSSFNYTTYGTYNIKQVVYNYTTGCQDSTTQAIIISQTVANFTLSNDSICKNNSVTLTSTSTSTNSFGTYSFNMGNGQNISNSPATYTYTTSGSYPITLTATNNVGCSGTFTFNGFDVLELPSANINPSAIAGCAPTTVTYSNLSTPQGNGYPTFSSFSWTFPDNSTMTTNNLNTNTNFDFTTQGTFNTSLVATDGFGCVSQPTTIAMNITLPIPQFTVDSVVCDLENFIALNNSTGFNLLTYEWSIDYISASNTTNYNGFFDENQSINYDHISHDLTLYVTDGNGCIDSLTKTITVSLPYANMDFALSGANMNGNGVSTCPPVFGTFQNQSNSYGAYNSNWIFGDGKNSSLTNPSNTYVFAGTYSLNLQITDQFGCVDDTLLVDYLTIGGPTVIPSIIPTPFLCDNAYIFDTLSPIDIDHFTWDFGDGTTITSNLSQEHNYPNQGVYYPILTIYDNLNCAIPYKDTLNIISNQLNANFTANPTESSIGMPVIFDDQSTFNVPITSWNWSFGDFNNTNQLNTSDANTTFNYGLPYIYTVSLIITDANGCKDTSSIQIHISGDIEIPNVFTPNGDGVNDLFQFPFNIFKNYNVLILNRWGNVVFENNNVVGTYIWNGKNMNSEELPDGVYFYLIKGLFKDETPFEKSGYLTKSN